MIPRIRLFFALLMLGAGLALGSPAQAATPASDEDRQILVMLQMPATHYRPGSGYAGSYGDLAIRAADRRKARGIAGRHGLQLKDGWPMPILGVDCYVMVVPAGRPVDQIVEAVAREPGVAWSQRMNEFKVNASPSAPLQIRCSRRNRRRSSGGCATCNGLPPAAARRSRSSTARSTSPPRPLRAVHCRSQLCR